MKKLLSLILILALSSVLMLTSCGGSDNDGTMNEESWEEMISAPSFENYTVRQVATIMGYEQDTTIKMTEDKVLVTMIFDGEPVELLYTGNDAAEQKRSYEELILAILADFENFTYDAEDDVYKTESTITVSITMTVEGETITADITVNNATVSIDESGKLLSFDSDYSQLTTTPEGPVSMTTQMHMEFSNYGTTVIE